VASKSNPAASSVRQAARDGLPAMLAGLAVVDIARPPVTAAVQVCHGTREDRFTAGAATSAELRCRPRDSGPHSCSSGRGARAVRGVCETYDRRWLPLPCRPLRNRSAAHHRASVLVPHLSGVRRRRAYGERLLSQSGDSNSRATARLLQRGRQRQCHAPPVLSGMWCSPLQRR
jgi:hypothetical protein